MIIAIDGSASSGKGTLAKRLAKHFGLSHLDTGALYRAVGLQLLNAGYDPKNIDENQFIKLCVELDITLTTSPLIRTERVAEMASLVAAVPVVRAALLDLQRQFAAAPPEQNGAILEHSHPIAGKLQFPKHPVHFENKTLEVRLHAPKLGQHSSEILRELEFSEADVEELIKEGIVS